MPFPPNPYIVGKTIRDPNKFFGREPEFSDINDSLQNNEQLILLYGQRRIGKSSVIAQIPGKLGTDEFVFISFDFQDTVNSSHQKIIHSIAIGIIEEIETKNEILFIKKKCAKKDEAFSIPLIIVELNN